MVCIDAKTFGYAPAVPAENAKNTFDAGRCKRLENSIRVNGSVLRGHTTATEARCNGRGGTSTTSSEDWYSGFPLGYSPPSNGHIMAPIAPCNVTSRETFRCTRSPKDTHRTRTHIAAPQHLACFLASRTGERAQFEKILRLNH